MPSRPPPVTSGPPPPYARVSRMYQSSLRPLVIVLSLITAIWSLIWAVDLFRDINVDKDHGQPKLATFAIVLGTMYITVTAIEVFGIVAVGLQRLPLVRIYTIATVVSSLLVIVAGFVRTIVHFTLKNDLIKECTDLATGSDIVFRFGIWGPRVRDNLSADEAESFCKDAWNHDSVNEIISLIIEIVLAAFFTAIAFGYYRQLLNPTLGRTQARAPSQDYQNSFPQHYNPPYLGYDAPAGGYAPPPGPPPAGAGSYAPGYDATKPPAYMGTGMPGYGESKDDPFADFDVVTPKNTRSGQAGESRDALV